MTGKNGGPKGPPTRREFSALTLEVRTVGVKIDEGFAANTSVLRQILRAVEAGNDRRDVRVDDLESRVRRLEQHTGLVEAPDER